MSPRYIAFYLPQFHPFPENDLWWGKGFTEWTNVAKAERLYPGHNQPRLPTDMGYYDLRVQETMREQAELAKCYGIDAFCFHYYWFDGKRLMDRPVDSFLADKTIDISFCFCWANENWTRRWDAAEHELLIGQSYGAAWEVRFIESLFPYFADSRYLRVDGKPLLVIYRPQHMPDARQAAEVWRQHCRTSGFGEIHIVGALVHGNNDYEQYGFDAGVEFPPHNMGYHGVNHILPTFNEFNGYAVEYANVARDFLSRHYSSKNIYRTVFPDWDNTARIKDRALIVLGSSPANYERWLRAAASLTAVQREPSEQLLFINAWNEWAEGCYLEPDRRHGRGFLEATLRVKSGRSVVDDVYDAAPERLAFEAKQRTKPLPLQKVQLTVPDPGSIPMRVKIAHHLQVYPPAYRAARFVYRATRKLVRLTTAAHGPAPRATREVTNDDTEFVPRPLTERSLGDIDNRAQSLVDFLGSTTDIVWQPFPAVTVSPCIGPALAASENTRNSAALRAMLAKTQYEAYPLSFGRFLNCIAHPLGGALVTSDDKLIAETMRVYRFFQPTFMNLEYVKDTESGPIQLKPAQKFVDADVLLAFHRSHAFGHVIFDGLPAILTLIDQIKAGSLKVLLPRNCPPWFRSILAPFGLVPHHYLVLPDGDDEVYCFRSVIASSALTTHTAFLPHPQTDRLFQTSAVGAALGPDASRRRRLYISRRPDTTFSGRIISNAEEVETAMRKLGFDIVDPAGLPYEQQAQLFREADVIVGAHGSAFANLIWSKAGARVIDLVPDDWIGFWGAADGTVELWVARICALRGLRYEPLLCQSSVRGHWKTADYVMESHVDVTLLRERVSAVPVPA